MNPLSEKEKERRRKLMLRYMPEGIVNASFMAKHLDEAGVLLNIRGTENSYTTVKLILQELVQDGRVERVQMGKYVGYKKKDEK